MVLNMNHLPASSQILPSNKDIMKYVIFSSPDLTNMKEKNFNKLFFLQSDYYSWYTNYT